MREGMNKEGKIILLLILFLSTIFFINFGSAVRTCYGCANCTEEIRNSSVSGDIVQLANSIPNAVGTCVNFSGMDNVTFDCVNPGNYIKGDGSGYAFELQDIVIDGAKNNTIINCNISFFSSGIFFSGSTSINNTVFNVTSNNNTGYGINLNGPGYQNLTNTITNNNVISGITLGGASNNIFKDIISNNNLQMGIRLVSSSTKNTLINCSANNHSQYGIYMQSASSNNIINSSFQNNSRYDVYVEESSTVANCNQNFINVIGSGGGTIEIYNQTDSVIQNKTLSELILCNADNSNFSNITITHGLKNNNGVLMILTQNTTLNDINSSGGYKGLWVYWSGNNTIANSTFNNNSYAGIVFESLANNTLFNVTVNLNYQGIYVAIADNGRAPAILTNITVRNNTHSGIVLQSYSQQYSIFLANSTIQENMPYDVFFSSNLLTTCMNMSFTNVIGSGGNPIELYNSPKQVIENKTLSELILCGANDSIINNVTIQSSNTLKNNALFMISTNNVTISNVNSMNNYVGIYLSSSLDNTLSNITVSSNNFSGILLQSSYNNSLKNITSSSNYYGVYLVSSSNNILSNMTIIYNTYDGANSTSGTAVYFGSSHNNTLKDSQIRRNYNQALYIASSKQNNITNCIIENHSNGGMKFTGASSTGNIIYNNFFNSTLNYNDTGSTGNFFNITKTSGTNIVGGDYIGGNYWGYINQTGFSETCTDADGDDICDTSYDLNDGSYDYLPLRLISFTLPEILGDTTSPGGDSPASPLGISQTSFISSITPEIPAVIEITNHYMSATRITINVNKPVSDVSLTITEVNISSEGFQGLPYQAFEITTLNLSNADINNATIEFRINKTELSNHNLTIDDVFLYRKPVNATEWSVLNTTYLSNDTSYYYFSAVSPGFSTFLIFISKEECIPAEKRCFQNQVQFCLGNKRWLISEVCDYKCLNGKCIEKGLQINLNPLVVYPIIGIVVVGVLISFLAQRMSKSRRKDTYYTSLVNRKFRR